ncbi:UNKNOWN [Stylonychia lemnae]|uniref:Dickkopf N-terminal cysteine-rich domain-containing protein n=1 Tax=Stylonychia lemnae TaxID=5949 RepID=A0A078B0F1_STYLE|nr:UNKNOWN [Stylonychia lemnae]|eukprot:CDW88130.1 UNKNOWN [Stylonychia lemnae]
MKYLVLLVILYTSIISAKIFAPYCRPRTLELRYCRRDNDCQYSDEYCSGSGSGRKYCQQVNYFVDPCRDFVDNGEPGLCAATLCPERTYCRNGKCYRRHH